MKGVSEIIAIILILMIVVALAALAYTWFSGMFSNLTSGAQSSVDTSTSAMSTLFKIDMAKNTSAAPAYYIAVTVRCLGQSPLNINKLSAYINDAKVNVTNYGTTTSITYGQIATFNVTNTSALGFDPKGAKLRLVTDTGMEQSATIQ